MRKRSIKPTQFSLLSIFSLFFLIFTLGIFRNEFLRQPEKAVAVAGVNIVGGAGAISGTTGTFTGTVTANTFSGSLTGTASNSDMTDGLHVHGGRNNEANKIVRTDGNGYIQAGWINTDSGDSGVANRLTRIYSSHDNYLRYSTLGDFKVHMGLSYKNTYSRRIDYTSDSNYWVGSMGGSGYGANETFHGGSGFFDIWSGTNYPPGTSHIHGFNALHYTVNSLGSTGGNAYGIQLAGQHNQGGTLYTRGVTGGGFSSWYKIWSQVNDGSGSGLDADAVDGYHVSTGGSANTIPTRNGSGYLSPANWTQFDGYYGIYSPNNGAHFYPNDASYGSWRIQGTRNGWGGIEFPSGSGNISLMIGQGGWGGMTTGMHANSYGWLWRFEHSTLYAGGANFSSTVTAPTFTGTLNGAAPWGSISGRPGWLSGGSMIQTLSNANTISNSGFYENGGCGSNWPSCTWYNSLNIRHSNQSNGHGFQLAMSYYDNKLWFRSYQGGIPASYQTWQYAVASNANGNVSVAGTITAASDERLKTNIQTLPKDTLAKVLELRGVYFNWKPDPNKVTERQIGVIAQEVEKIYPELVITGEDGYKSVAYDRLGPILIEAVKEQQDEIDSLQQKVNTLEERLTQLESKLK